MNFPVVFPLAFNPYPNRVWRAGYRFRLADFLRRLADWLAS